MKDIFEIACAFRMAIEEAVRAGEIREMDSFPIGCCTYASDLLQRYLIEQYAIFTWYISGRYGYGWNGENHAWLEIQDGIVIDITGDQYKSKKLKFTKPVYVGQRANGFHDQFQLDTPVAYSKDDDTFVRNIEKNKRYETVIKHIH